MLQYYLLLTYISFVRPRRQSGRP